MNNIPQSSPDYKNLFASYLASAARNGVDPAAVEQILAGGIYLKRGRISNRNSNYEAEFITDAGPHRIQISIGRDNQFGCIDCGERQHGDGTAKLDNHCPYAVAAIIQALVNRRASQSTGQPTHISYSRLDLDLEPVAPPIDPAQEAVTDLLALHPELTGWAERGLALYQEGKIEFDHYQTGRIPESGAYACNCPARAPLIKANGKLRSDLDFAGKGCKHALAQHIHKMVGHQVEQAGQRELEHRIERRRYAGWYNATPDEIERAQARQAGQPSLAQQGQTALDRVIERAVERQTAAGIGDDIKRMLNQAEAQAPSRPPTAEEKTRSYDWALKPDRLNRQMKNRQIETGRPAGGVINLNTIHDEL